MRNTLNKLVPLAELSKSHGLKGELRIILFNEESRVLKSNQIVFLNNNQNSISDYKIEYIKYAIKNNRIKFFEIDTKDDADKLKGLSLNVPRDELPQLNTGEYYLFDLIEFNILDEFKNKYGIVVDVLEFPSNNVLVVHSEGKEHLIPIIDDVILEINHNKEEIIVNPIPGLFNL